MQEREEKGINDVAISRVEQVSPFPYDLVRISHRFHNIISHSMYFKVTPHFDTYPNADILWCQVRTQSITFETCLRLSFAFRRSH